MRSEIISGEITPMLAPVTGIMLDATRRSLEKPGTNGRRAMTTEFHSVLQRVAERLPGVRIAVHEPYHEDCYWFADILYNGNPLVFDWCKGGLFGLTSLGDNGYGQKPDEVYKSAEEVAVRIIHLLEAGRRTQPPAEVVLRELRAQRNFSQAKLAEILRVEQPAVSRREGRLNNMRISSLQSIARALDGRLVIQVHFKDGTVHTLRLEEEAPEQAVAAE